MPFQMVERRLTRRDQAGLPQPDRASLLASAGGARETYSARETTAAGASFFTFLSHITRSWHKRRISHQTSERSRGTSARDWQWHMYTNNVTATITNGADPSDTRLSWHGRLARSTSHSRKNELCPRWSQRHAVDGRARARRRLVTEKNQTTTAFHTVQTKGESAGGISDNCRIKSIVGPS